MNTHETELFHATGGQGCFACGATARYSILLIVEDVDGRQIYLPNQHARAAQGGVFDRIRQVPFCHPCMRVIEGGLRATIALLTARQKVTS